MSITVVVTRDVENRYRGFLDSVMLEISPGVYTSANMSKGVRERVWHVIAGWYQALGRGTIVMTWGDPGAPSGQGLLYLGEPPRELVVVDGMVLVRRTNR